MPDDLISKPAATDVELHPIIKERWSPRSFDRSKAIDSDALRSILEAGRWSPSSSNSQPWRFIIGVRGGSNFESISEVLLDFNRAWAPLASAYIVICAAIPQDQKRPNSLYLYDCGIASAFMTVEANSRGLAVHQIAGFDREALAEAFKLDESIKPIAILVIGRQAAVTELTDPELRSRETSTRSRKALAELVLSSDLAE